MPEGSVHEVHLGLPGESHEVKISMSVWPDVGGLKAPSICLLIAEPREPYFYWVWARCFMLSGITRSSGACSDFEVRTVVVVQVEAGEECLHVTL